MATLEKATHPVWVAPTGDRWSARALVGGRGTPVSLPPTDPLTPNLPLHSLGVAVTSPWALHFNGLSVTLLGSASAPSRNHTHTQALRGRYYLEAVWHSALPTALPLSPTPSQRNPLRCRGLGDPYPSSPPAAHGRGAS